MKTLEHYNRQWISEQETANLFDNCRTLQDVESVLKDSFSESDGHNLTEDEIKIVALNAWEYIKPSDRFTKYDFFKKVRKDLVKFEYYLHFDYSFAYNATTDNIRNVLNNENENLHGAEGITFEMIENNRAYLAAETIQEMESVLADVLADEILKDLVKSDVLTEWEYGRIHESVSFIWVKS